MGKPAAKRRKAVVGGASAARRAPRRAGLDLEAAGLVVLGLGILLAGAVYAPRQYTGLIGGLHDWLRAGLGWAAYLVPVPPLALGATMFLRRLTSAAVRAVAGSAVVVYAALVGTGLLAPDQAGSLAKLAAEPLGALVGPAALALVAIVASLGLELALGLSPTLLLRGFLGGAVLATARVARAFRVVFGAARDSSQRALAAAGVRRSLETTLEDLEDLGEHYPGAAELDNWTAAVRAALEGLSRHDDDALERARKDAAEWAASAASFTAERARDARAVLGTEDAGAAAAVEEVRRLLAASVAGSGRASRALEGVRRALLLDAAAVGDSARRDARERETAARALDGAIRPGALNEQIDQHAARAAASAELRARADALVARANGYAGWPELVARLERTPHPETLALAAQVADALRAGGADALPELPRWTDELLDATRRAARAPVTDAMVAVTAPATSVPALTDEDSEDQDEQLDGADADYEAVFELDYPAPAAVVAARPPGRPVLVATEAGPVLDAAIEEAQTAPWVSPPERAAAKMALAAAGTSPRPAASAVGERIENRGVPAQGGIAIEVPGGRYLDPAAASGLDLGALDRSARSRARIIDETLSHFGLQARVVDFARGPTVTRYEVEPAPGEKISRIASLQNDLARALAVGGVRIEAPVPGKSVIGLEVPNADREPVTFRTGVEDASYARGKARLPLLLGKSIDGEMVVGDLARMPHLLIAGSTGSGKSVCVNTLIMSLLFRYLPTELRFIMVDPKMVELTPYDGIPHLVRPVVTNPNDAAGVLLGCVAHMERRYKMMSAAGAKNLEQYNAKARQLGDPELPFLVVIIDELADLMITSAKEVEAAIMRLAQMARATGMHLVLATQRPSVDILTSLIKVNVPARIAFAVSSGHDSRTILDTAGAERLTGYGDMLFYQPGLVKPLRLQGPYISEGELARVTEFLRRQFFDDDFGEAYGTDFDGVTSSGAGDGQKDLFVDYSDPLLRQAAEIVIEEGYASVSRLQRRLAVGHARAGKLVDALEGMKIVGPHVGSKAREVLVARDQLVEYFG